MKWEKYSRKFIILAFQKGYNEKQISEYLKYSENLYQKNLPIIYDIHHFSLLVGYNSIYLLKVSNSPNAFYRSFKIPKKTGGERNINEPLPNLKEIQNWILLNILNKIKVSEYAKAYVKGKNLKDNARYHRKQKIILKIDILKFFENINFEKVYNCFRNIGYNKKVSTLLSNLCSKGNSIPQGSPTSPAISNIIFKIIDDRISGFSSKNGIRYTRYADDLSFSGSFDPGAVINFVRKILSEYNFKINNKKIRVMQTHQSQTVTGVLVNNHMQAQRNYRKKIRQEIYYIKKYGLTSHIEKIKEYRSNYLIHLLGKVNFVNFIDSKNTEFIQYNEILLDLLKNYK